jgi:hypothetical protein
VIEVEQRGGNELDLTLENPRSGFRQKAASFNFPKFPALSRVAAALGRITCFSQSQRGLNNSALGRRAREATMGCAVHYFFPTPTRFYQAIASLFMKGSVKGPEWPFSFSEYPKNSAGFYRCKKRNGRHFGGPPGIAIIFAKLDSITEF